jgi:hypothetical protein
MMSPAFVEVALPGSVKGKSRRWTSKGRPISQHYGCSQEWTTWVIVIDISGRRVAVHEHHGRCVLGQARLARIAWSAFTDKPPTESPAFKAIGPEGPA